MNELLPDTKDKYFVTIDDDDTLPSDYKDGKGCAIWSLVLIVCIIVGAIFLFT